MGGNDNDGHVTVNQCDGAVFHLGGGIALGVDIGYFLQLQGPFQCYGIAESSAQVEEVVGIGECPCQVGHVVVRLEHFADLVGNLAQPFDHFQVFVAV